MQNPTLLKAKATHSLTVDVARNLNFLQTLMISNTTRVKVSQKVAEAMLEVTWLFQICYYCENSLFIYFQKIPFSKPLQIWVLPFFN